MPFKIRINFKVPEEGGRETWIKIHDVFNREYVFDLQTVYNKIYLPYKRDLAIDYFEKVLKIENDIFRLKNKTPRKRVKILLSLKYLFSNTDDLITEVGNNEVTTSKIYLKLQKTKKLKITKGDFVMKISIEKTDITDSHEEVSDIEHKVVMPYKACHSSDSEVDMRDPDTYTCTFYNHNGILAATTCRFISR